MPPRLRSRKGDPIIRDASNADEAAIREVVYSVLAEYGLAPDPGGTDADLVDLEGNYWNRGGVFHLVLSADGSAVGCAGLFRLSSTEAELRKMYLLPAARGRGIGRLLLRRLIADARRLGYRRVVLETASVLTEAIELYRSAGFSPVSRDHLSPRCDQAWELSLPPPESDGWPFRATLDEMRARELTIDDRAWAERLVSERFASHRIVSRGVLHDARTLPGLIAESQGAPVGLLQYRVLGEQFEVVVLIAVPPRRGVGRFLLREAEPIARSHGCKRLWLITTNDNTGAIAFYGAVGWHQAAIHRGAMRESRRLKPEIPEFASDGTPIEDEIEFERLVEGD